MMTRSFRDWFAAIALTSMSCGTGLARAESRVIPDTVTLYAGQALVQNAPGPLARIAVGDGKILNVRTVGKQELVMIGEKPGDTSMQLWMIDGSQRSITVHVTFGNSEQ